MKRQPNLLLVVAGWSILSVGCTAPAPGPPSSLAQDSMTIGPDSAAVLDAATDVAAEPDVVLVDTFAVAVDGGDAGVDGSPLDSEVSTAGDVSQAAFTDCYSQPDGKDMCCTTNPAKGNFKICYPKPADLNGGEAASGGCGAGNFKSKGVCKNADCSTVSDHVDSLVHENMVPNGRACVADSDCALVDLSTECRARCPSAVNKTHLGAYQQATKKINTEICQPFAVKAVCKPNAASDCQPPTPGCVKGHCAPNKQFPTDDCELPAPTGATCFNKVWKCDDGKYSLPPDHDTCIESTCSNIEAVLAKKLNSIASHDVGTCQTAADCTDFKPTGFCAPSCYFPVNKANSQILASRFSAYDTYCKIYFWSQGCAAPSVTCKSPTVDCQSNKCVLLQTP